MRKITRNIRQILVMLLAVAVLLTDNSMTALASELGTCRDDAGAEAVTENQAAEEAEESDKVSEDSSPEDGTGAETQGTESAQISDTDAGEAAAGSGSSASDIKSATEHTETSAAGTVTAAGEGEITDAAHEGDSAPSSGNEAGEPASAAEDGGLAETAVPENESQTEDTVLAEETAAVSASSVRLNQAGASLTENISADQDAPVSIGGCVNEGVSKIRLVDVTFQLGEGLRTAKYKCDTDSDGSSFFYEKNDEKYECCYIKMYDGDTFLGTTLAKLWSGYDDAFFVYPNADTLRCYVFIYDTTASFSQEKVTEYYLGTFSRTPVDTDALSASASQTGTVPGGFQIELEMSGFAGDYVAVSCIPADGSKDKWTDELRPTESGTYEIKSLEMGTEYFVKIDKILPVDTVEYGTLDIVLYEKEVGVIRTGPDEEVDMKTAFPDEALRSCIYEAMEKTADDTVMLTDLYKISELSYSSTENPIHSLAGIEKLSGLKIINLTDQEISDVRKIDFGQLPYLYEMNITKCCLSSFPDLSGTNVINYDFEYNYITDSEEEIKKKLPPYSNQKFDYDTFAASQVRGGIDIVLADEYYMLTTYYMPLYARVDNIPVWKQQSYTVKYSLDGGTSKSMAQNDGKSPSYTSVLYYDYNVSEESGTRNVTVTVYDGAGSAVAVKTQKITFVTDTCYYRVKTYQVTDDVASFYYLYVYGDVLGGMTKKDIDAVTLCDAQGNVYATGSADWASTDMSDGLRYPESFRCISGTQIQPDGFAALTYYNGYKFKLYWNKTKLYGGSYDLVIKFSNGASDIVKKGIFVVNDETQPSVESVSFDRFDEEGNPCFNIVGTKLIDTAGSPQFRMTIMGEDGSRTTEMLETKLVSGATDAHYISVRMSCEGWETMPESVTLEITSLSDGSVIYTEVFDFLLSSTGAQYGGYYSPVNGTYVCYLGSGMQDETLLTANFTKEDGTVLASARTETLGGKAVFVPQVKDERVNLLSLASEEEMICVKVYDQENPDPIYEGKFSFGAKRAQQEVYLDSADYVLTNAETLDVSYVDSLPGSEIIYDVQLFDEDGNEIASGKLEERDGDRLTAQLKLPGAMASGNYQLQVSYEGIVLASKQIVAVPTSPLAFGSVDDAVTSDINGNVLWNVQSNLKKNQLVYITATPLQGKSIEITGTVDSVDGLTTRILFYKNINQLPDDVYYLKACISGMQYPVSMADTAQDFYTNSLGTLVRFHGTDEEEEESDGLSFTYTTLDQHKRIAGISGSDSVDAPYTVKIYEVNGFQEIREIQVTENSHLFTETELAGLEVQENYYDIAVYSSDLTCVAESKVLLAYDGMEAVVESGDCLKLYPVSLIAGEGGMIYKDGEDRPVEAIASEDVYASSKAVYDIVPQKGYKIKDVILDGDSIGAYEQVTLENVMSAHQIIAIFTKETGGEDPVEKKVDEYGNEKNLKKDKGTAYPVFGSTEESEELWEDEEGEASSAVLTAMIHGNGSVIVNPTVTSQGGKYYVEKGTEVTIRFEPEEGYVFEYATIDGTSYYETSVVITNVSRDHVIHVFFEKETSDAEDSSGNGSTGEGSGSGFIDDSPAGDSSGDSSGSGSTGGDSGSAGTGDSSGSAGTGDSSGSAGTGGDSGSAGTGGDSGSGSTGDSSGSGNAGAGTGGDSESGSTGDSSGSEGTGSSADSGKNFTISVTVTNGTASGKPVPLSSNQVSVAEGSSQTIYFESALDNYVLKTLKVDGVTVSAADSYEFKNVSADHTVEAVFEQQKVMVTFADGLGDAEVLELAVGKPFGVLPVPETEDIYIFDGWYKENGEKITAESVVGAGDLVLTAKYMPITVVTKQKIDVSSFFASELEEYLENAEKPKYKYIVHTLDTADGKLQPNTAKSDNKLGSVAAKTGIFTAKSAGKACIVLATYDAEEKEYVEGDGELIVNVVKPSAKKQTLTYAGQSLEADGYLEYLYADKAGTGPNYASVEFQSSKSSVVKVDPDTGKITAVRSGTAKITMITTTQLGSGKPSVVKTAVSITVKIPSFKKSEVVLKEGKLKKIALSGLAKGLPVSWESSEEAVATVDQNGKVKALAGGKATITATVTSLDGTKTAYSYDVYVD